jgi:hypothetical protein
MLLVTLATQVTRAPHLRTRWITGRAAVTMRRVISEALRGRHGVAAVDALLRSSIRLHLATDRGGGRGR